MSDDSCNCGCNTKNEAETKEDCACGCECCGDAEPKASVA
jgi:hypothetical protein